MNLKKIGKVFTSKFVGTGPSSYEKRIYRAAVSKLLGNGESCTKYIFIPPIFVQKLHPYSHLTIYYITFTT